MRTRRIVAVFGGADSDAVLLAKKLGDVIAKRGHILLTGGTRAGSSAVKESAITGVGSSPWIGVDRSGMIDTREVGSGLVVDTDLGHKRNYLEACLCDAAVALAGGDGTVSEVTFALFLQRPVALVGGHWTREGKLGGLDESRVKETMIRKAFDRVGRNPSSRKELDAMLNESVVRNTLTRLPPYAYFESEDPPETIVDWILSNASSGEAAGDFPPLNGYEDVRDKYQRWLDKHAT